MKEKGIIMSGNHPKLILDGIKTMTRRVIKPQPELTIEGKLSTPQETINKFVQHFLPKCPYGQVGDRLIPLIKIPQLAGRYYADTEGNIWSNAWGKFHKLKGCETHKGYLGITSSIRGERKTHHIHRLVCEAFYGEPPEGLTEVRHLDGNPQNNAPDNLDWCNPSQNWLDRLAMNRGVRESHWAAKLTEADIDTIRTSTLSQRQLAKIYCVSQPTINDIKNNKIWKDIPIQQPPNLPRWASRITLEITGVRVERLQEITIPDAEADTGIKFNPLRDWSPEDCLSRFDSLWDSLNAKRGYSWESNPFVWVISFKRV